MSSMPGTVVKQATSVTLMVLPAHTSASPLVAASKTPTRSSTVDAPLNNRARSSSTMEWSEIPALMLPNTPLSSSSARAF